MQQRFQPKTEQVRTQLMADFPKLDVAKLGQKMVLSLPAETGQATIDRLAGELNDFVIAESGEALYPDQIIAREPGQHWCDFAT